MHIVAPARYKSHPKHYRRWPYPVLVLIILLALGTTNYLRPLPAASAKVDISVPPASVPNLSWPTAGQSAVAADTYGLLGSTANQSSLATASIAKVITALCVLQKEPIPIGQSGPTFTVNANDVAIYNNYVAEDGSLLPVQQGEQLTEYQAIVALMVPSANNIADSLVQWVFGSQAAYVTYASKYLQVHGLDNTHIGSDASGFDPSTTSTASDLTQLGLLAMQNPVLMQIAGQNSTALPVVGVVNNYDTVLGQNGITGLKTGNNAEDTGAFLFTATTKIGDKTIPLAGAVMGATDLSLALKESVTLAGSLAKGFQQVTILSAGQKVGQMSTPWGGSAQIITSGSLQLIRWQGTPITERHEVHVKVLQGIIGDVEANAGPSSATANLKLTHAIPLPSFWWRLSRHSI
jgi:D-alanyl-D-alanine carboxypeptidase (penicillin-binding protein 5/6)